MKVPVETVNGLVNCGEASGIAAVLPSEVPDEQAVSVVAVGVAAVVVAVAAVVFASVVVVAALVVIVFAVVNVNPIATGVIAFSATSVGADAVVVTPSSNAAVVVVVPDVVVVAVVVTHVPVCRVVVVTTGASVLFDVASYAANFIEFMVSSLSTDTLSLEGRIVAS